MILLSAEAFFGFVSTFQTEYAVEILIKQV